MTKWQVRKITNEEWLAEGQALYGERARDWKFRCVKCGNVQSAVSVSERNPEINIESTRNWIYFSCEGRRTAGVGCDWTLGGLFKIHRLEVIEPDGNPHPTFEFADHVPTKTDHIEST